MERHTTKRTDASSTAVLTRWATVGHADKQEKESHPAGTLHTHARALGTSLHHRTGVKTLLLTVSTQGLGPNLQELPGLSKGSQATVHQGTHAENAHHHRAILEGGHRHRWPPHAHQEWSPIPADHGRLSPSLQKQSHSVPQTLESVAQALMSSLPGWVSPKKFLRSRGPTFSLV